MRFGEFLYENQLLSDEELIQALADHWSNGGTIGAAICRQGLMMPEQVESWAEIFHGIQAIEAASEPPRAGLS